MLYLFFFFQAEDGIRDVAVTGVQTCALPIWTPCSAHSAASGSQSRDRPRGSSRRARLHSLRDPDSAASAAAHKRWVMFLRTMAVPMRAAKIPANAGRCARAAAIVDFGLTQGPGHFVPAHAGSPHQHAPVDTPW